MKKSLVLAAVLTALLVVASGVAACRQATPTPAPTPAPRVTPAPTPAPTPTPAPQKITWKFFTTLGVTHDITKGYQVFAEKVKERTKGQLEITVYPAGELPYKGTETFTIIKNGFVDIAGGGAAPFGTGDIPLLNSSSLPFLAVDADQYRKANELSLPYWDKELERFNAKRLDIYSWPPQQVWNTKDVSSIDQLKGTKLRTYNEPLAEIAKIWGAVPMTLIVGEVPTALQRGTVDGVVTAAFNLVASKWEQFMKSVLVMDLLMGVPDFTVVSMSSLNALPPDVRQAFLAVSAENTAMLGKVFSDLEVKNMQIVKDLGIKVYDVPLAVRKQQQKLAVPLWEAWAQRTGPAAQELMLKIKQAIGQ